MEISLINGSYLQSSLPVKSPFGPDQRTESYSNTDPLGQTYWMVTLVKVCVQGYKGSFFSAKYGEVKPNYVAGELITDEDRERCGNAILNYHGSCLK